MAKLQNKVEFDEVEFVDEPVGKCRPGRRYRFPFDTLPIGGCFIVKGMTRNILSPYKVYAERHLGWMFKSETRKQGVYVWRIS